MDSLKDLFHLSLKQNPGTFEQLHKESRATLPTQYMVEGCKFDLASNHNPNFQTNHSFGFTHKQSQYHFGSVFANSQCILHGQVSGEGVLQARGHYNWIPSETKPQEEGQPMQFKEFQVQSTTKMQAQLAPNAQQNVVILEHEYLGDNFSLGFKSQNANPFDKASLVSSSSVTGVFSASYLQQITKNLALGAEYTYSRPFPDLEESSIAYGLKYTQTEELPKPLSLPPGAPSPYMPINPSDPTSVFTMSYTPASAMLHSSYWRRINQR
jgi:mitochondrial import receptor subunit TOM40